MSNPRSLRIVFLGTPEFAATCLQKLVDEKAQIVAVITAPDKPAGRGLGLQKSAVKQVAEASHLPVLQPEKLKDENFLAALQALRPDLGIVVAFRMLPQVVWQMPRLGTFNLHGSLLPQYRGAAPINRALMNGETETGITTFFLKHEIDTGDLLLQEKIAILPEDNAGSLYHKMMHQGAELVWKTVEGVASNSLKPFPQPAGPVKMAPKIFKETCLLDFRRSAAEVHNQVRGLSPLPGAFMLLKEKVFKILEGHVSSIASHGIEPGTLGQLPGGELGIATLDYWFLPTVVQPEGKRKMTAKEFLAGHPVERR